MSAADNDDEEEEVDPKATTTLEETDKVLSPLISRCEYNDDKSAVIVVDVSSLDLNLAASAANYLDDHPSHRLKVRESIKKYKFYLSRSY